MSSSNFISGLKNSKVAHLNKHLFAGKKVKSTRVKKALPQKKKSKALISIEWNLEIWCKEKELLLQREQQFLPDRKWRFDFTVTDPLQTGKLKIAVEFEGGVFQNRSGHKTAKHYTKDTDKYNAATAAGWKVLRFTALNYGNLITELNKNYSE